MAEETARWALPLIVAGQAQKEMTHNEALALIDLLIEAEVVAAEVDMPPVAPEPGACWVVGQAPSGAWHGHAHAIAGWTDGGWRFVVPREGMTVRVSGGGAVLRFADGAWAESVLSGGSLVLGGESILAARGSAIPMPSGGATVDTEARLTLGTILQLLQHHRLID